MAKYNEIIELHEYCQKIGVEATLTGFMDGYLLRFANGGDFIQHRYSYGAEVGYVEPAIGSKADYHAVSLKNAKRLVRRHKDKLNRRAYCATD